MSPQPTEWSTHASVLSLYTSADRTIPNSWGYARKSMTRSGLKRLVFALVVLVEPALGQSALGDQAVEAKLRAEPYLMIAECTQGIISLSMPRET